MLVCTCPNTKCAYDEQLQPSQRCPLCGEEGKEFKFNKFGDLLKKKHASKKSASRTTEYERVVDRIKYCPTCGSPNMFWASGLPQFWSLWECRECGYKGALILEDGNIATKLRKEWKEKHTRLWFTNPVICCLQSARMHACKMGNAKGSSGTIPKLRSRHALYLN